MKNFVLFLLGAIVPGALGITCPFGWSGFGGLCVKYIGFQNYYNSVSICRQLGGRLFEPRTQELSNYLASIVPSSTAWIGINDNRYASNFQTVDYTQTFYGYNFAYVNAAGQWFSTTTSTTLRRAYCELPRTNTECATVSTIFVEDSFAVSSNTACQDACRSTVGCKFWTFGLGKCGLRFYETQDVVGGGIPGVSSTGYANFIVGTNGRVLVGKALKNIKTARECQEKCSEDPKCNSFTWTNIDFSFGGINTETCVFNYGKTIRKLSLPGTAGFQVVSGPPCCNAKTACQKADDSIAVTLGGTGSTSSLKPESEEATVNIDQKALEKCQKELEDYIKKLESKLEAAPTKG